jgi:putative SOS response-associated peptidase YedK
VPGWANSPRDVKPQINARSDGVATKPFFREAFKAQRCLVVADGYYEWHARDKPYLVRRPDDGPIAFAGMWDVWTDGAEKLVTCCFVTTDAADWLAPIHPRMPVILRPDDFDAWLSQDTPVPSLLELLRPYPGDDLEAVRVSTLVNNVRNDSPECLAPAA